jgi:hypothetical protein
MVVATDCQQRRKILNRRFSCCVLLVSFPLSIVVFCLLGQIHYPVRQIGPCSWPFYIISKSCDGLSESVILPVTVLELHGVGCPIFASFNYSLRSK